MLTIDPPSLGEQSYVHLTRNMFGGGTAGTPPSKTHPIDSSLRAVSEAAREGDLDAMRRRGSDEVRPPRERCDEGHAPALPDSVEEHRRDVVVRRVCGDALGPARIES